MGTAWINWLMLEKNTYYLYIYMYFLRVAQNRGFPVGMFRWINVNHPFSISSRSTGFSSVFAGPSIRYPSVSWLLLLIDGFISQSCDFLSYRLDFCSLRHGLSSNYWIWMYLFCINHGVHGDISGINWTSMWWSKAPTDDPHAYRRVLIYACFSAPFWSYTGFHVGQLSLY